MPIDPFYPINSIHFPQALRPTRTAAIRRWPIARKNIVFFPSNRRMISLSILAFALSLASLSRRFLQATRLANCSFEMKNVSRNESLKSWVF